MIPSGCSRRRNVAQDVPAAEDVTDTAPARPSSTPSPKTGKPELQPKPPTGEGVDGKKRTLDR